MTVRFKSKPEMFKKEALGLKCNTLRKIDVNDQRFLDLRKGCDEIVIDSTEGNATFVRKITDYTEWEGWAIISWKHPKMKIF